MGIRLIEYKNSRKDLCFSRQNRLNSSALWSNFVKASRTCATECRHFNVVFVHPKFPVSPNPPRLACRSHAWCCRPTSFDSVVDAFGVEHQRLGVRDTCSSCVFQARVFSVGDTTRIARTVFLLLFSLLLEFLHCWMSRPLVKNHFCAS